MKYLFLWLMALLYVAAGVNHFLNPAVYLRIMPPWLPWHSLLVTLSGVAEILLGLLLLPAVTRPFAAWGIIALLVAVFPANIQMLINWQREHHPALWMAWVRLPLQAVLIWWAWRYTKTQT